MLFFGSSHVVADGHNRLSTQNWWCACRQLATCQQLVNPHLLGTHINAVFFDICFGNSNVPKFILKINEIIKTVACCSLNLIHGVW
jgi:hypothetical protein